MEETDKRPDPARPFPGLKGAALLMLGGWAAGFLAAAATGPFVGLEGTTAVGNITGLTLMTWAGVRRSGAPAREVLSLRPFRLGLLAPLVGMALAGSVLAAEIGNWVEELFPLPGALRDILLYLLRADTWMGFIWRAALLALMAPVTEEFLFRGVFQHGLVANYGPVRGVCAASICFGVFHLIPWQVMGASLIGLLLGTVVHRTGSILAGMVLHAVWNFLPLFVVSVLRDISLPGYAPTSGTVTHIPFAVILSAAAVFALTLKGFWRGTACIPNPVAPTDPE